MTEPAPWPSRQRTVLVDLVLAPRAGADDALIAARIEWQLAAVPWVAPRVVGGPERPGLAGALVAGPAPRSLQIGGGKTELCGSWAGCRAVDDGAAALLEELGLEAPAPPDVDPHARAAAHALFTGGRRVRRAPDAPMTDWLRARMELVRGDPGKAVVRLARALKDGPHDVILRADLAVALEAAGRTDEALQHWRQISRDSPLDPRFVLPAARAALAAGDPGPARELLRVLPTDLRALPGIAELRDALRGGAAAEGEPPPPEASLHGLRGLERDPDALVGALARTRDPLGLTIRGEAQLRRGNSRDALRDATHALRLRPWLPEALALKADALRRLGRDREAEEARRLSELVAPDPARPR